MTSYSISHSMIRLHKKEAPAHRGRKNISTRKEEQKAYSCNAGGVRGSDQMALAGVAAEAVERSARSGSLALLAAGGEDSSGS
jgi:hypothetical protein